MNNNSKRIGILGIGGVGGFIGAPLAAHFSGSQTVEIIFICRGETLRNIIKDGLHFKSGDLEMFVQPALASQNPQEIGKLDALFLTTKSYALADALKAYESVLTPDTLVIPLQNMVNATDVITSAIPGKGKILEGCIYVVSNLNAPGDVEHKGGPGKVFIGGDTAQPYKWLPDLLTEAGVDVTWCENMKTVLWRKFLFLSPVAGITTAYNKTFGELLDDVALLELLRELMLEVKALAAALGVRLEDDIVETSIALLGKFPYHAKSSMQLDFEQQSRNEKPYLIDYVIEKGTELGTPTAHFRQVNDKIAAVYPVGQ